MQIEVPSDKYDSAVQAMENRIKNGQIPGVSDPGKAKEIVRRGAFTYEQVRNIARFGTVQSLTYDARQWYQTRRDGNGHIRSVVFCCRCLEWRRLGKGTERGMSYGPENRRYRLG